MRRDDQVRCNSQLPTPNSQAVWELGIGLWALAVVIVLTLSPEPRVSGQEPAVRMVADEGEGAKYWPRWRGPSGQGVVTGTGYVDTWSSTQNVLWKTAGARAAATRRQSSGAIESS